MMTAMKHGCKTLKADDQKALDPEQAFRLKVEVCEKLCKYPEMVSKDCSALVAIELLDNICRDCPMDKY